MTIEIKAPAFPESVADGEVSLWHKQEGDFVQRDELLVEIETDKVVMEVVAPEAGRLDRILVDVGNTIESEALLAELHLVRRQGLPSRRRRPSRRKKSRHQYPWGQRHAS